MVLNYYNLRQQPFGVAPDPRFLLMSRTHREAYASLTHGLNEERGFMALAAPPGMGKTTLLFSLLESLRDRARTVFLFHTQCDPKNFFRYLVRDLGLEPGPDPAAIHDQLNEVLLFEAYRGRRFVLVVDEAQGLQPAVLETIRLLSDFEAPGRKLMQIIIAGQLGLIDTLMRHDMEQLRQRISIVTSLQPFNQEEVADYVMHRLKVAGHEGFPIFTEPALRLIARESKGIPRNINNICFNALSTGYALRKEQIGQEVIEEVVADLRMESLLPRPVVTPPTKSKIPRALAASAWKQFCLTRVKKIIAGTALLSALLVFTTRGLIRASAGRSLAEGNAAQLQSTKSQSQTVPAPSPTRPAVRVPSSEVLVQAASRVVVVAPGQAMSGISKRYLGKYNLAAISKLRALNPTLAAPDRILVGRQIRVPEDSPGTGRLTQQGVREFVP